MGKAYFFEVHHCLIKVCKTGFCLFVLFEYLLFIDNHMHIFGNQFCMVFKNLYQIRFLRNWLC